MLMTINDALNHFLLGLDGTNAALLGALLAGMMAIDLGRVATKIANGGTIPPAITEAMTTLPPSATVLANVAVPKT
jgi:PTS system fructose-specific IIC component